MRIKCYNQCQENGCFELSWSTKCILEYENINKPTYLIYMEDISVYVLNNRFTLLFYPRERKSLFALEHIPSIIISMASDLEDFFFFSCNEILPAWKSWTKFSLHVCALHNEGNVVWKYHKDLREKNILMVLELWDKW